MEKPSSTQPEPLAFITSFSRTGRAGSRPPTARR
jgi:hypothetical protein